MKSRIVSSLNLNNNTAASECTRAHCLTSLDVGHELMERHVENAALAVQQGLWQSIRAKTLAEIVDDTVARQGQPLLKQQRDEPEFLINRIDQFDDIPMHSNAFRLTPVNFGKLL